MGWPIVGAHAGISHRDESLESPPRRKYDGRCGPASWDHLGCARAAAHAAAWPHFWAISRTTSVTYAVSVFFCVMTHRAMAYKHTVLLVDDDPDVRDLLTVALAAHFYLLVANNAAEAIKIITDWQIDLLLTDIVMPGMSGFDLADHVISTRPGVRVIYMTGYFDQVENPTRPRHGKLVRKPFRPADMVSEIKLVLAASRVSGLGRTPAGTRGSCMKAYRCYFLDGESHIIACEVIECGNDERAKKAAETLLKLHPDVRSAELWDEGRCVGLVERQGRAAGR
jgi:CheY-like chemotaxis protein